MRSLRERWFGEWSSPTAALKKRLFCYCLHRFFPLILPLSASLELELLNGYARLEDIHLDPLSTKSLLKFLNQGAEMESVGVGEVEVWIAWDKVLAMYDPEYDMSTFDVATVVIQAKGVKASIRWEAARESTPEPEALKASMLVVQSEMVESFPADDTSSKKMQGSLESIPEEEDEVSSEWMKRILQDMQVNVQDLSININDLRIHLESLEFTTTESIISGFTVECADKSVVECIDRMTLRGNALELQSIHLHLHPSLLALTGLIQFGTERLVGNAPFPQFLAANMQVTIHSDEHHLSLSGRDVSLTLDGLSMHGFDCSANGLTASSEQFTITKSGTRSFEVCPLKVAVEACFLDTLNSFSTPWMSLGSYKRDALNVACSKLDLTINAHAMMIEQLDIALSSSIKASIKSIKSDDFSIKCIRLGLKQTLRKSALNLSVFHPQGHFPFDSTKVMLEDTPFIKCPPSNVALFRKLAERSQRVLEVVIEGVEVSRDMNSLDLPSYYPSNGSECPAMLLLIRVADIAINQQDARLKDLFLAYFVNDQLALGDIRADIQSLRYPGIVVENTLVSSKGANLCASFIKRDCLTVAVESDGLLISLDELPKIAHPSLTTNAMDFYAHLRRTSFKWDPFKDKDVIVYIDGLKITPKVFYGNALSVYHGTLKPVSTLYSNPHLKWTDAGLQRVIHSDVIYGRICGTCIEVIENEFTIIMDSTMASMLSPTQLNAEGNVDIRSMMSIDEITGKMMDSTTAKDTPGSSSLSEEGVINRLDELNIDEDYMLGAEGEREGEHEFPFRDAAQCIRFRDCSVKFKVPSLALLHLKGFSMQLERDSRMLKVMEIRGHDLRARGRWPLFLHRTSTNSSLPDVNLTIDRGNFRLRLLPLRVRIDQGLLIGLSDLLCSSSPSSGSDERPRMFDTVYIAPVHLSIDYQPQRIRLLDVPKHPLEMLNLFPIRDARLSLSAIRATKTSISACIHDFWLPTLTSSQHARTLINSITPVRTVVRVGSGFASLLLLPIQQYRQDGRLLRGLTDGVNAFTRSAGIELTQLGASMFTTTANAISTLTDIPPSTTSLNHIRQTIIAIPVQDGDLIRAVPVAILNAVQGVTESAALAMRAANRKMMGLGYEGRAGIEDDKGKSPLICYDAFDDANEDEDEDDVTGL